jgi:hypothetical protein
LHKRDLAHQVFAREEPEHRTPEQPKPQELPFSNPRGIQQFSEDEP